MRIPSTTSYPLMPRGPSGKGVGKNEQEAGQRTKFDPKKEKPKLGDRLARWAVRWGVDILLVWGAGCVSAGAGWIYPPAGLIAAGVLLIAGGVLWARGGGAP